LIGLFIAIHGIERLAGLRPRRFLPVCVDVDGDGWSPGSNIAQALFHHIDRCSHPKKTGARDAATRATTRRCALRNALKTPEETPAARLGRLEAVRVPAAQPTQEPTPPFYDDSDRPFGQSSGTEPPISNRARALAVKLRRNCGRQWTTQRATHRIAAPSNCPDPNGSRIMYQSDITQFINQLKAQKPSLEEEQRRGRALLWDKQPIDLDERAKLKTSRVEQTPYVYYQNF
jgi:hypothetical protein